MGRGAGGHGGATADRALDGARGALAARDAKPGAEHYGVSGIHRAFHAIQSSRDEARRVDRGGWARIAGGGFATDAEIGAGFYFAGAALDAAWRLLSQIGKANYGPRCAWKFWGQEEGGL